MTLFKILRDTGVAIVRAPLLWIFSMLALIPSFLEELWPSGSLLSCISLLLLPIIFLAQAGQIRSVQLYYEGTSGSLSQIIRHGARKIGPLIQLLLVSLLLFLPIGGVLWFVMKTLLPQISSLDSIFILFRIASFIFYPFIAFAQCAIVISDLSVSSSLPMVFQALKKDAFTVIVLVVIFGVISYFLAVTYRGIEGNLGGTAFYYIAQLIVNVIQSAVFTFAYFYCIGDAKPETSTSNLPT